MRTPLSHVRHLGSAKSGTDRFWHERLTSVASIPLTIIFVLVVLSLIGRNHAAVVQILGHPFVALMMLLFVGTSAWHMKLGMQVIIEDYVHHEGWKLALLLANAFFSTIVALAAALAVLKLSFGV